MLGEEKQSHWRILPQEFAEDEHVTPVDQQFDDRIGAEEVLGDEETKL